MAKKKTKAEDLEQDFQVKFTSEDRKKLLAYGCDSIVFREPTFSVEQAITPFKPAIENVKTKKLGERKQLEMINSILRNPMKNQVICISSYPSDSRAKSLAAFIMAEAIKVFGNMPSDLRRGKSVPKWHRVTGGYKDEFRDSKAGLRPAVLVLSNITSESTPSKLEKVRDILDMYEGIPRIVVVGGKNPVDFFTEKMFYPLDCCVWLGSKTKVTLLDKL